MNIETGKCPCKTEPSYGLKQEIASVNGATVLTAEVKSLLGVLNINTVKYPCITKPSYGLKQDLASVKGASVNTAMLIPSHDTLTNNHRKLA